MKAQERRAAALARATNPIGSWSNYPAIFQGFAAMGVPVSDIQPRVNVLSFEAWRALGRHVRKGEHGVKVLTYIETDDRKGEQTDAERVLDDSTSPEPKRPRRHSRPWVTRVFHISQTDPDTPRSPASV